MDGFYSNFVGQIVIHSYVEWYDFATIMQIVKKIRYLTPSEYERAESALEELKEARVNAPYGPETRFPQDKLYMSSVEWINKYGPLLKAVDLMQNPDTFDEGIERLNKIADEICWDMAAGKFPKVYDRFRFEEHYNILWHSSTRS